MYSKPYFKEPDREKIIGFIQQNPFALVIATGADGKPEATQVPLLIDISDEGKIRLTGHVSKKSGHHLAMKHSGEVLVIFTGPHAYVSASWYTDELSASTWNYMSVHARGKVIFRDEQGTVDAVRELTELYEGPDHKASFQNLPDEYVQGLAKAIEGFDIEVESLQHVFKLSQNRSQETRKSISQHLHEMTDNGSHEIALEIDKRIQEPRK